MSWYNWYQRCQRDSLYTTLSALANLSQHPSLHCGFLHSSIYFIFILKGNSKLLRKAEQESSIFSVWISWQAFRNMSSCSISSVSGCGDHLKALLKADNKLVLLPTFPVTTGFMLDLPSFFSLLERNYTNLGKHNGILLHKLSQFRL